MARPDPKKVVLAHRQKTAGEVRFIKDRGSNKDEWGWGSPGPNERQIQEDFVFNAKYLKPLALTMRSALMALGHATSAHARLVKVKSRNVSPDGALGGKGYIQKIPDMRRQLMNTIEALSALTDTIHDEMNAPHWDPAEDKLDARDREEVREIVEDSDEIRVDPEGWAADQEEEIDEEHDDDEGGGKTASTHRVLRRLARRDSLRVASPRLLRRLDAAHAAVIAIEPQIMVAQRVSADLRLAAGRNELNYEVADLVSDLRAASKHLRKAVEMCHV